MKNILITGSSGFIGSNFIKLNTSLTVREIDLLTTTIETSDFSDIHSILHLSALVHQMKGAPENEYFKTNSDLAFNTAKKAKEEGVSHIIYMSTVKVYGEFTNFGESWNEDTERKPIDPYGKSKLEGEKRIKELEDQNFAVSIIRTPIVYGPGVKANMYNLMALV